MRPKGLAVCESQAVSPFALPAARCLGACGKLGREYSGGFEACALPRRLWKIRTGVFRRLRRLRVASAIVLTVGQNQQYVILLPCLRMELPGDRTQWVRSDVWDAKNPDHQKDDQDFCVM